MKLQYVRRTTNPERWHQRYLLVCRALKGALGNRKVAAFALHVPARTLHYWVAEYRKAGLEIPVYKRKHTYNVVLQQGLAAFVLDMSTETAVGKCCAGNLSIKTQTDETRASD